MKSNVVFYQNQFIELLGGGISRRVLAYLPEQMIVEVTFTQGAVNSVHAHPQFQSTYVCKGEFIFTVENELFTLREGDSIVFASHAAHGCQCRQAGILLDVYTPMRADFID